MACCCLHNILIRENDNINYFLSNAEKVIRSHNFDNDDIHQNHQRILKKHIAIIVITREQMFTDDSFAMCLFSFVSNPLIFTNAIILFIDNIFELHLFSEDNNTMAEHANFFSRCKQENRMLQT